MSRTITTLTIALGCLAMACGDDGPPPSGPGSGPSGSGAGTADGGTGGTGATSGAGGAGADGGGSVACVASPATAIEIYAAAAPPALTAERMAQVGARRILTGTDGFVFLDLDGSNADEVPQQLAPQFNRIAAEGDTVGIVAATSNNVTFQRFDDQGVAVTGPRGLAAEDASTVSIASNAGETVITWGYNSKLRSRTITAGGSIAGPAVDVLFGAYSTFLFLESAARDNQVGVVYSSDPMLGSNTTHFLLTDASGALAEPVLVHETEEGHQVNDIVATDQGWVVLLTGEPPEYRPLLITLDPSGQPTSEPMVLEGAQFAYSLASPGDRIAVAAGRDDGEPQLRVFDLALAPRASWVCLGEEHEPASGVALAVDGEGFAAVHTTMAGAILLHRVDSLGTGENAL